MDPQAAQWHLAAEGDCGMSSLLVPSPQSEAVTHEMEELSLQPTQSLPPLSERKNGEGHGRRVVCIHDPRSHINSAAQLQQQNTIPVSSFDKNKGGGGDSLEGIQLRW